LTEVDKKFELKVSKTTNLLILQDEKYRKSISEEKSKEKDIFDYHPKK